MKGQFPSRLQTFFVCFLHLLSIPFSFLYTSSLSVLLFRLSAKSLRLPSALSTALLFLLPHHSFLPLFLIFSLFLLLLSLFSPSFILCVFPFCPSLSLSSSPFFSTYFLQFLSLPVALVSPFPFPTLSLTFSLSFRSINAGEETTIDDTPPLRSFVRHRQAKHPTKCQTK